MVKFLQHKITNQNQRPPILKELNIILSLVYTQQCTQDEKQRTYPGGVGFHDEYKINSFDENTMAATCVDSLFRRKNLLDLAEICPDAQQVRTG